MKRDESNPVTVSYSGTPVDGGLLDDTKMEPHPRMMEAPKLAPAVGTTGLGDTVLVRTWMPHVTATFA